MTFTLIAFFAGVLTVAAPCILPLLPIIVGGAAAEQGPRAWVRPLVIAASLAVSVVVFTLLLKSTTLLLGVPVMWWQVISGGIVILVGAQYLFPHWWERLLALTGIASRSNVLLGSAGKQKSLWGAVLVGAALGPVFNSCSPTYALIVATVLPVSFSEGLMYIIAYAVGLAGALLPIAYAGQVVVRRLQLLANPHGWFRRLLGIIFIAVGLGVMFGLDKTVQTFVLEQGWYDPISNIEHGLSN